MDNADSVLDMGRALGSLAKHVAVQIPEYSQAVIMPCSKPVTDTCYDPGFGNRIFDFITPMADIRTIAAALLNILVSVCANAAGPFDIILYPLMDINLAKGVHNLMNAAMFTLLQVLALFSIALMTTFSRSLTLL